MPTTLPIIRPDGVALREYVARRERLLRELKNAAGVIYAGDTQHSVVGKWRPDLNFLYLTGIETEAGAAVAFDPSHPNPKRRIGLFLRPLNPEADRWEGYRDEITSGLRRATGFDFVARTSMLPSYLAQAARRLKRLACLHPLAPYTADVSPDLAVFRRIAERTPGTAIEDRSTLLASMRAVKSNAEINIMRRAADATAAGYEAALRTIRPGIREGDVQQAMERAYLDNGAEGTAYGSIVGSGVNATVLHYSANSQPLREGDLLLIDSGAQVAGYACDVTRTFPVSGKFTPEQRSLYELVLRAQMAAIKAARPGRHLWQLDEAARKVIEAAGHGDAFPHGIGHHLGLHVHDADPDAPLAPGAVITIEPGIYLPEKGIGIRIEDDVLIGARSNVILTEAVPKTVEQIERAMRNGGAARAAGQSAAGGGKRRSGRR